MSSISEKSMEMILRKIAGSLTAAQAAKELGISRKTYYEREARALRGMRAALEPGRPGRPRSTASTRMKRVEVQNQLLQQQVEVLEQRLRVREVLAGAENRGKKK